MPPLPALPQRPEIVVFGDHHIVEPLGVGHADDVLELAVRIMRVRRVHVDHADVVDMLANGFHQGLLEGKARRSQGDLGLREDGAPGEGKESQQVKGKG
jgi:hypothetical protein